MHWPEKDIFEGIRKGDRKIFDSVFREYHSGLCTFANDYVRSFDLAEEIVQEVFLNIWEKHYKIQVTTSLKAYLYKCVRNYCLNYIRNKGQIYQNFTQLEQLSDQSTLLLIEIPDENFDIAFSEKMEVALEDAIYSLPEQCQNIFRLNRYEKYSYPEIASQLGVSLSTVKTQMSRAMKKIRDVMDNYL